MARSEARLQFGIWDGLAALSDAGKLAYMVVLTEETVTHCGKGALRKSLWGKKLSWSIDQVDAALSEMDSKRYVFVDEDTEEILVRTFIRGDQVERRPNVMKAALKSAPMVKSPRLRLELAAELRKLESVEAHEVADQLDGGPVRKPLSNGSASVPQPSANGSARPGRPPERCPAHLDNPTKKPCRACGSARRAATEWDAAKARAASDANAVQAKENAAARIEAAKGCSRCDGDGRSHETGLPCDHKPAPILLRRQGGSP